MNGETVSKIRAFAHRRPVLTFYALVFAISWGGILILVAPGGIPGEPEDVARLFPFTLAALFAAPALRQHLSVLATGVIVGVL